MEIKKRTPSAHSSTDALYQYKWRTTSSDNDLLEGAQEPWVPLAMTFKDGRKCSSERPVHYYLTAPYK